MGKRRCTATTAKQRPCKAWAVSGTDPSRCAAHGGAGAPPGAPSGNNNATTHSAYASNQAPADLPAAITALETRIHSLALYIDGRQKLSIDDLVTLVSLQGELTSRLGRLLKIWSDLNEDDAGDLTTAINQALDLIGDAWSLDL